MNFFSLCAYFLSLAVKAIRYVCFIFRIFGRHSLNFNFSASNFLFEFMDKWRLFFPLTSSFGSEAMILSADIRLRANARRHQLNKRMILGASEQTFPARSKNCIYNYVPNENQSLFVLVAVPFFAVICKWEEKKNSKWKIVFMISIRHSWQWSWFPARVLPTHSTLSPFIAFAVVESHLPLYIMFGLPLKVLIKKIGIIEGELCVCVCGYIWIQMERGFVARFFPCPSLFPFVYRFFRSVWYFASLSLLDMISPPLSYWRCITSFH